MYYKLNENLLLRGWQLLPYCVVNISNGETIFVSKEVMSVLELANGKIDMDLPLFPEAYAEIKKALIAENAIVPCENGDSILPIQEYKKYDNRWMKVAHWSVTGRCNYRCKHCYMSAFDAKYGELSHEDIMAIIDQLEECGIFQVSLTGGEALVRSDFLEIVDALLEKHITITTIYSNGLLVSEKLLKALDERGIHPEFNMSFDGTEGWHDWLRGVDGATKTIDRAFKLCREYGFPTGAEMCLHKKNKHTLRDSVNYLASVGCGALKTCPVTDVGAWHDGGYGESIGMEELFDLYLDYIGDYYRDGKPLSIHLGGFFVDSPNRERYDCPSFKPELNPETFCVCGHARQHLYISADGRALPCMALSGMDIQEKFPFILETGLKNCLHDSFYINFVTMKAKEVLDYTEKCRDCEYRNNCCGGCRASAMTTTPGDLFAPDEAACMIIRGGYKDKIDEVVKKALL